MTPPSEELWVSFLCHEMRTSVQILKGYLDLGKNRGKRTGGISQECREFFQSAEEEVEHIHRLLDRLSQLSEGFEGEDFKVMEIFPEAYGEYEIYRQQNEEDYSFTFEPPDFPVKARIEENDFKELIRILFENATKYSPKGESIHLSFEIISKQIIIILRNSGIGVRDKDCKKLKDPYFRGNNKNELGMGLGLALANVIVKNHNGKLQIKSDAVSYTEVKVQLPIV